MEKSSILKLRDTDGRHPSYKDRRHLEEPEEKKEPTEERSIFHPRRSVSENVNR